MLTLKQQIQEARDEIRSREIAIEVYKKHLRALEDSRVDCKHEFSKPFPGYEHEGGECIHCGINELYAQTLAFLKNKSNISCK